MATVVTEGRGVINITWTTGLTDFVLDTDLAKFADTGMFVKSIQFIHSQATDRMVIRDGGITGPVVFDQTTVAAVNAPEPKYYGRWMKPCIDATDCTVGGTLGNARVIIEFG